ncbi:MAG: AAA family ATPase, partial [Planctomycetota bacterium]
TAFRQDRKKPFASVQKSIDSALKERREQIVEEARAFAPIRQKARQQAIQQEIQQQIRQVTAELPALDEMLDQLSAEEKRLMGEFRDIGSSSIDVEMMRAEIKQLDLVIDSIARQREELNVELRSRPRVTLLQPAEEAVPSGLIKRLCLSGVGGILAFVLPLGLILSSDLVQQRIGSASGLDARMGIPVVGTIPVIPPTALKRVGNSSSKIGNRWRAKLSESAKRISAHITRAANHQPGESLVLMITSPNRGDGKTTLSGQLARSLASKQRSVILCDFDLRRPRLHAAFNLDNQLGVSDLLRDGGSVANAIVGTEIPGLSVLPGGSCCSQTIAALADGVAGPLIKELRDRCDVLIIDGGPVLSSADASYLCPYVDQIYFTVRRDHSRSNDLKRAIDVLPAWEHQVAGLLVIDKVDDPQDQVTL